MRPLAVFSVSFLIVYLLSELGELKNEEVSNSHRSPASSASLPDHTSQSPASQSPGRVDHIQSRTTLILLAMSTPLTSHSSLAFSFRASPSMPSSSRGLILMLSEIFFSSSSCSLVLVISLRASCTLPMPCK